VEEVIHQQFAKVDNLPKEISNLNAEFYLWKSVLPAATVVVFILVVFFIVSKRKIIPNSFSCPRSVWNSNVKM